MKHCFNSALALVVTGGCLLLSVKASALPTFARKYRTSCQTCHVAYPKLTPFGEAFRRNNYHFPDMMDEDYVKTPDVPMGSEGYKKVFPKAVWPGAIPGDVGLSAVAVSNVSATTEGDAKLSFGGAGGEIQLTAAGTLGDSVSLWAGAIVAASSTPEGESVAVELHRVFLNYSIFERPSLIVRVGRIDPSLVSFSSHRMLFHSYRFLSSRVLDNPFSLEPAQLGIELTGTLWHRLGYSVGIVEGGGAEITTPKDVYGHVQYKLGGLPLDGSEPEAEESSSMSNPAPWREKSVTLGAFGYAGMARISDADSGAITDDRFFIVGGDVNAIVNDLNAIGVFTYQRDSSPKVALPDVSSQTLNGLFELDWVAYPWLIPLLRYEVQRSWGGAADGETTHEIGGGGRLLIRANVAAGLTFSVVKEGHNSVELSSIGIMFSGAL